MGTDLDHQGEFFGMTRIFGMVVLQVRRRRWRGGEDVNKADGDTAGY